MAGSSHAAVSARLVAADPALPNAAVSAVVAAVVPAEAAAARLLDALTTNPALPLSGAASMPPALQRIIARLSADFDTVLRLPRCEGCDREMSTLLRRVQRRRLCLTCSRRTQRTLHRCVRCATTVLHVRVGGDQEYCPPCWRELLATRHETLASVIRTLVPTAAPSSVATALETSARTPTEQLKLVLDIAGRGVALFADLATGSAAFARFYRTLQTSQPELPPLLCGRCGRDRPLVMVFDGRRVCLNCYKAARHRPCAQCGQVREIVQRLPDGSGICQACRHQLPDASGLCIRCGNHRRIAIRTPDGPICTTCRLNNALDTCRRCGQNAPCRFAGTDRAICESCRRTRIPCSQCGKVRLVSTRDADGEPLCHSCAELTRVREPCVLCGTVARVVTRFDGAPVCGTCYRNHPASFRDCPRCGAHRRIRRSGLCDHCTIVDLCDDLFPATVLDANPAARSLRDALITHSTHRTVAAFLRPKSITHLRTLLQNPAPLTHDAIDRLGDEQATMVLRSALIEYGLLEPVDVHLRRFEQWISTSSTGIADDTARSAYLQYATWKHLRELRTKPGPISPSLTCSRRSELKIVLDLLGWAESQKARLADLDQGHIDLWSLTGTERYRATGFLRWAHRNNLCRSLTLTRRRHDGPVLGGMPDADRSALLTQLLRSTDIDAGTKLAAALILLYGIRPHRIVRIELTHLGADGGLATILLGTETLHLPEELHLVAEAAAAARDAHRLLHTVEDTRWLFPGRRPGYPIASTTLRRRLHNLGFPTADVRKGALITLASIVPPVVLAELTGIHISTAIGWRDAIAASRARYVRALQEQPSSGQGWDL